MSHPEENAYLPGQLRFLPKFISRNMGNMCWNEFKYGSAERKEQFEIRPNLSIWVE